MTSRIPSSIQSKVASLYPEGETQSFLTELDRLLESYQDLEDVKATSLSHKDCLLISYGDQLNNDTQTPLQCLHEFANEYLSGSFSAIHILPFYPYTSDDGFSVSDFEAVHPEMGSWKDVQELSNDFQLMFDAVFNHASQSHHWVQSHLQGDPDFQNFAIETDPTLDLSQVVRPRALPLLTEFEKSSGEKVHIWTTFSADQVDLNVRNPKVLLELTRVLLEYVRKGARLIRLDAIAFLWKEPGTTCLHLEQTHTIIRFWREVLDLFCPEVLLITETNVPHEENVSYFGNDGDEAQLVYQFPLPPLTAHAILQQNGKKLTTWAKGLEQPTKRTCFFNFMASHDGVGVRGAQGILSTEEIATLADHCLSNGGLIGYKNNPDGSQSPYELNINYLNLLSPRSASDDEKVSKFLLSQSILLTMPGLPAIYFHSLVGSENYSEGVKETGHNRTINREKLNLNELKSQLSDEKSLRHRIYSGIVSMIECRKVRRAFHPRGVFEVLDFGNEFFAIQRNFAGESLLCVHNLTSQEQSLRDLPSGQLILGESLEVLKPWGVAWIRLKS